MSMIGAVMLGVGTIFGLKADPEAHWSEPPHLVVEVEVDEADPGEPI